MSLRLVPVGEGPTIPLDRPIVLIGRHPECDVRIDSHKISRRHCCVVQLQGGLVIRDLGSTNGIYYNGQRVERAELSPDDEIQIGNLHYQLVSNGVASSDVSPRAAGEAEGSSDDSAARVPAKLDGGDVSPAP